MFKVREIHQFEASERVKLFVRTFQEMYLTVLNHLKVIGVVRVRKSVRFIVLALKSAERNCNFP